MKFIVLLLFILAIAAYQENKIKPVVSLSIKTQQALSNAGTTTEIVIDEGSSFDKGKKMNKVSKGNLIPNANYFNNDGNEFSFSEFKGKTVVIDFWATWCTPCLDAMPAFEKLANDFSGNKNLVFY